MSNNEQNDKIEERESEERIDVSLSDSSHPLMKDFREKAPGTHKHTQSLTGMIENVCASIDLATADVLKVAAMYHDIGKTWFPHLYSENQDDENIHENIDPWVSYQLITRHVSDTVTIMVANNFPPAVIRIASQHHGTTVVKGMFDKARSTKESANPDDFRYHTQKPDCIESLILMMCDRIEAASRSIYLDQKKDNVPADKLVVSVYSELLTDGQFDDVSVKLGLLKNIQEAIISDVSSNYSQKRPKHADNDGLEEDTPVLKEAE